MSIQGRAEAAVKGVVLWVGLGIVVLGILFAGGAFLIGAFYAWVATREPADIAGAITGGALLGTAIVVAIAGGIILKKTKKRQPGILTEFSGLAGMAGRVAGLLIRRDPRKSMVIAVIAGAVAEYITSGDRKKSK